MAPTPLEAVLAKLPDARRSGDEWMAVCPAHDDGKPSLAVREAADGRVLLHCHAGCTVDAVLAALDLNPRDLFTDGNGGGHGAALVTTYDYVDEAGQLLSQVCRFEPKAFRQRRPDHTGGWIWNLDGTPRVLYRLPEVVAAVKAGTTILVVEGEKDVEAVRRAGAVGTCNPGGARKWRPEYSEALRGAEVVIVADKDEPGRRHAAEVAAALRGIAAKTAVVEPVVGKDVSDHLAAGKSLDDLVPVQAASPFRPARALTGGGRRPKQADLLVALAQQAELFHAPDTVGYAAIEVDGHHETHAIRRRGFKQWLTRNFYEQQGTAPGSQAMHDALEVLEAHAYYDGLEIPTFLRVGEAAGATYLDLGDDLWRAIRITRDGWDVVARPDCRFRRAPGLRPLPLPARGGHISALRPFLNVASDGDFFLVVGAQLSSLSPWGPYPVENIQGEQGSAKTTTARVQRELCDPASVPLRTMPRDERDLHIAATNGRLLIFDNVSRLSPWISDALCRLSTGGGFSTRQLYTDQDEVLFDVMRPVIVTGIEDVIERDDLRDRSIILTLPTIPDSMRQDERTFWASFDEVRPELLGVLLDAVSGAMRNLGAFAPTDLPRMADFARWTTAAEPVLGWAPGTITRAYLENRGVAVHQLLDGDRFAVAILDGITTFTGTSTELLQKLGKEVEEKDRGPDWPKTPRGASGRLRRLAPALRRQGYEVEFDGKRRHIKIARVGDGEDSADRADEDAPSHGVHGTPPAPSNELDPDEEERRAQREGA